MVAAFSVLGRTFMRPVDCPFRAADRVLAQIGPEVKCVLVDAHAEAGRALQAAQVGSVGAQAAE